MSNTCNHLHNLFNSLPKHKFPFNINEIPLNGIYILFEKNELAHNTNRIVRIGTHTGNNQLISRLNQHFVNENKDRSIFRKNIGRALLNKNNDSFLKSWELDLTTKASRILNNPIDFNKQKQVEKEVTKYIQENFSFAVFEVKNKEERLKLESKIISTISQCNECKPSLNWLGLFSPKEKIRNSGLWLVNELNKEPLSEKELFNISTFLQVP
ncbi:hypothetical protein J4405_05415 [Candidatus Woesearchaeota archaeon]|nr:hypothetical protein [Candidatus Woesearchaeota archaeon]